MVGRTDEAPRRPAVVCGVDGSAQSAAAVAVAARLAGRLGARLVLAHVIDTRGVGGVRTLGGGDAVPPQLGLPTGERVLAAEALLAHMADVAGVEGAERRVVTGFAADRLADLADEEGAELIVVGSRGRGPLKAAFLGSVSSSLMGVARCPVIVVPPGATEAHVESHGPGSASASSRAA
jgi:nucleotide-binding universal stress UspA family protein